jgi:hypothetical protein
MMLSWPDSNVIEPAERKATAILGVVHKVSLPTLDFRGFLPSKKQLRRWSTTISQ